ncbi:MAG: hypothetical protein H6Q52_2510 [Deltaproteobacteria bacterium]|nr:hypothetical protein [Deltaproteobacteria bacterium]
MKNITVVFMILLSLIVARAFAQDTSEAAKIQYLIASVETLEGAKFIRNGNEYDARSASSHLRLKLKTAGKKVKTAEDFIKYCASKSSITGEPYLMRFADGTTVKSEAFFRNKLKAFHPDIQ